MSPKRLRLLCGDLIVPKSCEKAEAPMPKLQCTSAFRDSDCSWCLTVPSAKEMAKPTFKRWDIDNTWWLEEKQGHFAKECAYKVGRSLWTFCNLLQTCGTTEKPVCFSISLFFCPPDLKACAEITVSYDGRSLCPWLTDWGESLKTHKPFDE